LKIRICKTAIIPREILVPSESSDETHTVIRGTLFNDTICTCKGWHFRQTCKHARMVEETRCEYLDQRSLEEREKHPLLVCPDCGNDMMDYDLDPEEVSEIYGAF